MRLAEFILANREPILADWEAFARTCKPASGTMDIPALRDHANEMLTVIADDLAEYQSDSEQSAKSKGKARSGDSGGVTAAGEHGAGRADSGFTVGQMVAEYRALRASVIRLWTAGGRELDPEDVEDLTRFNEAIDQSLAESVFEYHQEQEQSKEMFIAILGHDLRLPIGAIYTSSTFMLETGKLEEPHRTLTARIAGSAERAIKMVGELLDFTRARLGGGIPVTRADTDLSRILDDVVNEVRAANSSRQIDVDTDGEHRGRWDAARISQALGNLIGNAAQHGVEHVPITVRLRGGDAGSVVLTVHNHGTVIPAEQLNGLFNPMKARSAQPGATAEGPIGSLGLGLYIAERIVNAHGGRVDVESSPEQGTTFTLYLPGADRRQ